MPDTREVGRVEFFDSKAGFGFIKRATGKDIFVHHTQIILPGRPSGTKTRRELKPGDEVEFQPSTDETGRPCALGVKVLKTHSRVGGAA